LEQSSRVKMGGVRCSRLSPADSDRPDQLLVGDDAFSSFARIILAICCS
jgi:hypothetical protein